MFPGIEALACPGLAVPADVMHHVVRIESSFNPYAIGVVGGRLARQPRTAQEAVATARMLEARGFNFSVGLAQVNRYNLVRQGLASYEQAFQACPNLQAGARILAECHERAGGDWGKAFSCYYSGNFTTGFRHGYVQKVFASMRGPSGAALPIALAPTHVARTTATGRVESVPAASWTRRIVPPPRPADAQAASAPAASLAADGTPADGAGIPIPAPGRQVAILAPAGRPPRLIPVTAPDLAPSQQAVASAVSASATATPRDAAFVF